MKRKRSVTHESVQKSKEKISTGNASTSGKNVQTTNSTGNAKVLRPFWNDRTKEISRRLWLPTRTVSAVSLLNWSNGSLVNTIQRSWYSVRTSTLMIPNPVSLPRIYYQSFLSLQQDTTAENRKRRREIENKKDTDLSNSRRKRKAKKVDGNREVDIQ